MNNFSIRDVKWYRACHYRLIEGDIIPSMPQWTRACKIHIAKRSGLL